MKCANCSTEVSIADSRCPKCNSDLLAFGATVFYEKSKHESDASSPATGMVFGAVENEYKSSLNGFNSDEKKIFSPATDIFKKIFQRHLTIDQLDEIFMSEIVPEVNECARKYSGNNDIIAIEEIVAGNLKTSFASYRNPSTKITYTDKKGNIQKMSGKDVLDILTFGEYAYDYINRSIEGSDLSAVMFAFCKASEVACWLHAYERCRRLKENPVIKKLYAALGNDGDAITIDEIPAWLNNRKGVIIEVINGILYEDEYYISGSMRTGVAISILGRDWRMVIKQKGQGESENILIQNIFMAKGGDDEKNLLANKLCDLQGFRNRVAHKESIYAKSEVNSCRDLSYECLKAIPAIMEI